MAVEIITQIGVATKYVFDDGLITYRAIGNKVDVKGDKITIQNEFLHPSDSQHKTIAFYGTITQKFGTNTPEEYVDYLFENSILFSGEASEVITVPEAQKVQVVGDVTYMGQAEPGSIESAAVWRARKIDETIVGDRELKTTWADDANYTQIATDLTSLSYS